jgi:hypothetical protein
MKKTIILILAVFLVLTGNLNAQTDELFANSKPASTNIVGAEYPRIDAQRRVIFRLRAPEAQTVISKPWECCPYKR